MNDRHFLFTDDMSGEDFIVGETTLDRARATAVENFGYDVRYICELTEEEAEASGLDEY